MYHIIPTSLLTIDNNAEPLTENSDDEAGFDGEHPDERSIADKILGFIRYGN